MRADRYKWAVVAMLWCVCFLNYADRQVIFTVFPLLSREFALSDRGLSLLSASFMAMYALFGPLAGSVCDRLPRRTVVLGALLFWSFTTAASAYAHRYLLLLAGVAMGGLGEAFYFPSAMSLVADYHGGGTRSRAMALHQSGVYVGSIAGGGLAGFLGEHYGWRTGFRLFGFAGIVLASLLWLLLKEPARGMSDGTAPPAPARGAFKEGIREIARNRVAWLLIAVFIGANFVAMVFTVWMPTFLFRKFHLSLSMAGLSGTAYLQVASVLGVIGGGVMADARVRRHPGIRGSRMLVQSLGLLCGVPFLFVSGWASALALALAAMIGFGLFKGVYESNLWASLYDAVPIERRGASLGIMNSLGWLGGAAAQWCMGAASQAVGMSACLSATAIIYLAIGAAMLLGGRRLGRGAPVVLR